MMMTLVSKVTSNVRKMVFTESLAGRFISGILSTPPLGRVAFRLTIFIKQFSLRMRWSQNSVKKMGGWFGRSVEYSWVLRQIERVGPGSLVLDIGSSESLLPHELAAKRFKVVTLDVRDYPFKSKQILFVKRNAINTMLPSEAFEAITLVSTIEHVGLNAYEQLTVDDDGDIRTMKELRRILSPTGIIILTTPYIGSHHFEVFQNFERLYNRERLNKLVQDFLVENEEYLYLKRIGTTLRYVSMDRREIDKQPFPELAGLACLVLKKR